MSERSEESHDWKSLREKVIGLGEESIRKSYYPELQRRLLELQESEAKYRSLVEDVSDWIWETDENDRFTYVSPRVHNLLGYEPEELLGLKPYDLMKPDDAQTAMKTMATAVAARQPISLFEHVLQRKDGTSVVFEINGRPVYDSEQNYHGYRGIGRDISKRKRAEDALRDSEEKFRAVAENAESIIVIVQGSQFIFANPYCSRITGYTSEEIKSIGPSGLVHPRFREMVTQRMHRRLRGEPTPSHYEFQWISKSGKGIWVDYYGTTIQYRGKPAVVGIGYDITERKQADEEKRAFYRETILSATDGKLDICDKHDVRSYIKKAQIREQIIAASQLSCARDEIRVFCAGHNLLGDHLDNFMIGVGEAIDNAVKHAGGGLFYAGADRERVWVGVSDTGSGIGALILPKAILRRGFSTKPSLGLGYSIMLQVADRILLCTGRSGTTVMLISTLHEETKSLLDSMPDTWESVGIPSNFVPV